MSELPINGRRHLLLIYIHGFMGNETSFQNFPAHVYVSLSQRLSASHTVEYIVYPRFKTRKNINVAGDDFSLWLQQHETDQTDIVLLGHSMGGLLAADVALLTSTYPAGHGTVSRHRILGVVGLDTPFLGMHPSVVVSGLGSLFKRDPKQPDPPYPSEQDDGMESHQTENSSTSSPRPSLSTTSLSRTPSNPITEMETLSPYAGSNLLALPDTPAPKPTTWSRALYFITKHSDNVTKASKAYLTSHFEFGSCMADYQGLMDRHDRIRALDDGAGRRSRTRFVNYYTATTGRPKRQKPKKSPSAEHFLTESPEKASGSCPGSIETTATAHETGSQELDSHTPSVPLSSEDETRSADHNIPSPTCIIPQEEEEEGSPPSDPPPLTAPPPTEEANPPPPPTRTPPPPPPPASTENPSQPPPLSSAKHKNPKTRHFCLLPRQDGRGRRDARWVRVAMRDVDEVGAHCGLFAAGGAHYAGFVREVAGRVEGWVGGC